MTTPTGEGSPALDAGAIADLRATLDGSVVTPTDPGYDEARAVWNGTIDRRPALIVRCTGPSDVISAVSFAREHELPLAVKGAGHNIAGSAICDDGLVIDLSGLRGVDVDPASRTVRVEPGATLADVDAATQEHGLALPLGVNSTTGIAGLALGGGFGWLSRKFGLTVDNLVSVEMVTADGERVHASENENPDLFWAIRGGGGNFGVVTSFQFQLHDVGPDVLAGLIVHPFGDARSVLRRIRDAAAELPDEQTAWMVLRKAPPLPFLPEEWHGREVLVVLAIYAGDIAEGEEAMRALRAIGRPIADVVGPQPYVQWQQALDPLLAPGARNYWKSHHLAELSDDAIDTLLDFAGRLPSDECEILAVHLGGAVNRTRADATAYPHRDTDFIMNIHTRWRSRDDDDRCIAWARDLFDAMVPHSTGGVYVNFMPADEVDRVRGAYGSNYDRLAEIKAVWDPDNLFRANQNIRPSIPA